jgi:hypothetical protein
VAATSGSGKRGDGLGEETRRGLGRRGND